MKQQIQLLESEFTTSVLTKCQQQDRCKMQKKKKQDILSNNVPKMWTVTQSYYLMIQWYLKKSLSVFWLLLSSCVVLLLLRAKNEQTNKKSIFHIPITEAHPDRIERGVLQTEPFPNRRFEMVIFLCDSLGSTWKRTPRQDLTGPILKINACGKTFGYTQIHITRGITQPAWKLFYGVLCGAEKL